jgi:predicted HicB family RNase H-like nuclease
MEATVPGIQPDAKRDRSAHGFMLLVSPGLLRRLEEESVSAKRSINSIANLALQDWVAADPEARQPPDVETVKSKLIGNRRISIRIEERLRTQLKVASSQLKLSMNKTLIGIIDHWLSEEKNFASATLNPGGSCSIELPPRLFREVGKLIQGAKREDTARMCLREMCFGPEDVTAELSTLLQASHLIEPILGSDRDLVVASRLNCLAGGTKDVLSRVRLRFALLECVSRLGVELNFDADGQSILTEVKTLSAKYAAQRSADASE